MNQLLDMKTASRMAYAISIAFLLIHIAMICMFAACGVTPMANFNIFSLAFYVFSFFLVRKRLLRAYSVLVYLEVVCHMALAVYYTGWGNGFQVTLIGMSALLFFAEYMGTACR